MLKISEFNFLFGPSLDFTFFSLPNFSFRAPSVKERDLNPQPRRLISFSGRTNIFDKCRTAHRILTLVPQFGTLTSLFFKWLKNFQLKIFHTKSYNLSSILFRTAELGLISFQYFSTVFAFLKVLFYNFFNVYNLNQRNGPWTKNFTLS